MSNIPENVESRFNLEALLGSKGAGIAAAMGAGLQYLDSHAPDRLLEQAGRIIDEVPVLDPIGKDALPDSFGGSQKGPSDDFLVGRGLFYITEQRRLFLDCTSGHYQMLWGYGHPQLCGAAAEAQRRGVVWDNHSNIPQAPVKQLARRLVETANAPGNPDPLDTVLLGVCTGSVACAAALKIQLKVFYKNNPHRHDPVIVVLDGNYHGSDMVPQSLRGMWPDLVRGVQAVAVQPNDAGELENAFRTYGPRIAGFWAEPVMMNREAIAVGADYLQLAQRLCREAGALMCIDEIQTGFWQPDVFEFRTLGLQPDLVVAGKGMTAGFHPLSAVILKSRHDVLEQYDAISTNGSAAMPAFIGLCNLELIRGGAGEIRRLGKRIEEGFQSLALEFPGCLRSAQGRGYLSGLKFKRVGDAMDMHRRALQAGLWTRVHAYHAGHSTLLTKVGLLADDKTVDFLLAKFRALLQSVSSTETK
jgi:acetylornithine/succinyldiaminopimelate/putrescine aminotransferase